MNKALLHGYHALVGGFFDAFIAPMYNIINFKTIFIAPVY
jgi:hypothetical protein